MQSNCTEKAKDKVEIWRDVVNYEGHYQVSNQGRVKSVQRLRYCGYLGSKPRVVSELFLKPSVRKGGYLMVPLRKNGKQQYQFIHRMVLTAFGCPCPNGMECCHKDGNPANNRLTNLRWDTPKNNCKDRGNYAISKLTEDDVKKIRRMYSSGLYTMRYLANHFEVNSLATIHQVIHKKTWAYVA